MHLTFDVTFSKGEGRGVAVAVAVAPVNHGGATVGLGWPRDGRGDIPLGTLAPRAGRGPGDPVERPQGRLCRVRACVTADVGGAGYTSRDAFREGGDSRISGTTAGMSSRTRPPGGLSGSGGCRGPSLQTRPREGRGGCRLCGRVVTDKAARGQGEWMGGLSLQTRPRERRGVGSAAADERARLPRRSWRSSAL